MEKKSTKKKSTSSKGLSRDLNKKSINKISKMQEKESVRKKREVGKTHNRSLSNSKVPNKTDWIPDIPDVFEVDEKTKKR